MQKCRLTASVYKRLKQSAREFVLLIMGQMGFMSDRTRNTTSQIITQVVNKAPDYPKCFGAQNNPDSDECLAQIWPTSTVFLWPTFGLE